MRIAVDSDTALISSDTALIPSDTALIPSDTALIPSDTAINVTTKIDESLYESESSEGFEVETDNFDSLDSDNEKSLDQLTFQEYFSDDEKYLSLKLIPLTTLIWLI